MMERDDLFKITIDPVDADYIKRCKKRWDLISKPLDGLGDFEEVICRIGGIRKTDAPDIGRRAAVIMCADNGIVDENISQSDKSITLAVTEAIGKGIGTSSTLARFCGADVVAVDVGIDTDCDIPGVKIKRVRRGTGDFLICPAMEEREALKAISIGIDEAFYLSEKGYDILAAGEMGIGNTTTSAAVLSSLLDIDSEKIVGRGAGLDDERLLNKRRVVREGVSKYRDAIRALCENSKYPGKTKAFETLRCLGGLDIAALTGLFIGGAMCHIPVIIDGFISATAALLSDEIVPGCRDYMIASHSGKENGTSLALKKLGLKSLIDGNMALGEGSGALMLLPLLDMVLDFYRNAARFEDYRIEKYERFN